MMKPILLLVVLAGASLLEVTAGQACPRDFNEVYGDSCYRLKRFDYRNFADAKAECKRRGAKLAEVETAEENDFLYELTKGLKFDYFWLGGSDQAKEGRVVWVSDNRPITFTNWVDDKDYDDPDVLDCISLAYWSGQWYLDPCDWRQHFICEFDTSE